LAHSATARRDKSGWPVMEGEDAVKLVREAGGIDFAAQFGGAAPACGRLAQSAVTLLAMERAGYDMMTRDLPSASEPEARRREIDRIAASLNRLDFQARRQLRQTRADVGFFKNLDAGERVAFLEKTLPEGFRQTIEALKSLARLLAQSDRESLSSTGCALRRTAPPPALGASAQRR
jgi:hypothetical protein